jgi:hypothetical protein
MAIRELTADEVKFEVECLPEDTPLRGNCSAIDPETDYETEKRIRRQLRSGNKWAWCVVRVVARWKVYTGDDYLGCCSYKGEKDFCQPGGYFDDMKAVALDNLNAKLGRHEEHLAELRV